MMRRISLLAAMLIFSFATGCYAGTGSQTELPDNFVHVTDITQDVILEIRYYSSYNFVGERIDGYQAPVAILSQPAAEALKKAATASLTQGYILKIFDAYRPQRAVTHFVRWATDVSAIKNRTIFYPQVDKARLFELGYIAAQSGHSRGSTVDLTLIDRASGKELDMGSPFDFFGSISHHGTPLISPEQTTHREILKSIMQSAGFKPYPSEWWHYTLANEPYPEQYFDFVVQ
jgi:D-alanyl-D-alanine dipeptidase